MSIHAMKSSTDTHWLERCADDVLRIADAIRGLRGLRQGGAVIGLTSDEYTDTLDKLMEEIVEAGNWKKTLKD